MKTAKPEDGQIRISLDSGANIHSSHDLYVEAEDLGFESRVEWDKASDAQKLEAVQDYFYAYGYPEWNWED